MNDKKKNKEWRRSLKLRTQSEYMQRWNAERLPINHELIRTVSVIMGLPAPWLYPSDLLSDILFNPYADLSDVEAILALEETLCCELDINVCFNTPMTLGDLFRSSCQKSEETTTL